MTGPRITVLPAGTIVVIVEPVPGVDDYAERLQQAADATAAAAAAARTNTPKDTP